MAGEVGGLQEVHARLAEKCPLAHGGSRAEVSGIAETRRTRSDLFIDGRWDIAAARELNELCASRAERVRPFSGALDLGDTAGYLIEKIRRRDSAGIRRQDVRRYRIESPREQQNLILLPLQTKIILLLCRIPAVRAFAVCGRGKEDGRGDWGAKGGRSRGVRVAGVATL